MQIISTSFAFAIHPWHRFLAEWRLPKKKQLIMQLKQKLVSFFITLLGFIPLSIARAIGRGIGHLAIKKNGKIMRYTNANIRACFPTMSSKEQDELAERSVLQTGTLLFETLSIWSRSTEFLDGVIKSIDGEELVHEALSANKGLIILAPHLGNWEVLGRQLPKYGEVTSLYQPPKKAAISAVMKEGREKSGATLVPTTTRGVSSLLKALKNGHISGILPDQVPNEGSGEFAPFFGKPAYTMKLVHKLIEKTQARVLVGFAERTAEGFTVHFMKPDDDIYAPDLNTSLAAMNASIEKAVLLAPEQYQWEYKRFKKRTSDEQVVVEYPRR